MPQETEPEDELKIFYCSRTHSQLTQFAQELRRVSLPPSVPLQPDAASDEVALAKEGSEDEGELVEGLKHVSLASRKNLCINPKVASLGSANAVNERCLELQQPGVSAEQKCPYLPSKDNEVLVNEFRDHTLAAVRDIEDIGKLGKEIGVCPYYATRSVIKHSEVSLQQHGWYDPR